MLSRSKKLHRPAIGAILALLFTVTQCQGQTAGVPAAVAPSGGLLSNDGNTNSLNALVQYLFNIPAFRKAVYASKEDSNFVTQLQRVFYQLQYNGCADTSALAGSGEWAFIEQPGTADVSELRQVLLGTILADTDIEQSVSALFRGAMENTVIASDANYESTKEENFLSVFLQVEGVEGLSASLKDYTSEEILEGENQIFVEGTGLVDGVKFTKFSKLPPVLQLDLRRFTFDGQEIEKLNTRFEYPTSIDFEADYSELLAANPDPNSLQEYRLQSIVSHAGDVTGGHYKTFAQVLEPESQSYTWYRFDDETVEAVEGSAVVEGLFGDGSEGDNAYLVTYVSMSDWENINAPAGKRDLSEEKRKLFEEEEPVAGCLL